MSIQQLDQATNRFGTTKVGDFLNSHTSPDGTQLIDDPDIPTGTINITENGTGIDVYSYATADVNVKTYENEVKATISGGQLQSVDIPDDVNQIRAYAFYEVALHNVNFGNVSQIGERAFQSTYISTVNLTSSSPTGAGGIVIGANAFSGCTNITQVYLPVNISSVGVNAFLNCTGITDVYYMGTQEQWEALTSVSSGTIKATGNSTLLNATIHYEYTPENEEA